MSKDTRLGVDPLGWVDPAAKPGTKADSPSGPTSPPPEPATKPQPESARQAGADRIVSPAGLVNPEEAMSEAKVKVKQTLETAQVASHLKDLATSLESGTLRAEGGEKTVVLAVPGEGLEFEMKVSRKKDKAKCSIKMEWRDDGSLGEAFKISDE